MGYMGRSLSLAPLSPAVGCLESAGFNYGLGESGKRVKITTYADEPVGASGQ